ncbi:hypothetical protein EMIT0P74_220082 [Pseudomonas sp. IT-P74]
MSLATNGSYACIKSGTDGSKWLPGLMPEVATQSQVSQEAPA